MFNQLCGYFPQQWGPAVNLQRTILCHKTVLLFGDFHVTPLVNNSIECNTVLPLEASSDSKCWPVQSLYSSLLGVLDTFREVSTAPGFNVIPQMFPSSSHLYRDSLAPPRLCQYLIPQFPSPSLTTCKIYSTIDPHGDIFFSLDPSSLFNLSESTNCSLVIT